MNLDDVRDFWTADTTRRRNLAHWLEHKPDWHNSGDEARAVVDEVWGAGDLGYVLEWGVGGGSVAQSLISRTSKYVGVDIAEDTLEEATARLNDPRFVPLLIDVDDPESVTEHVGLADALVSAWCFTHFPGIDYTERVLWSAAQATHETGRALVHVSLDDSGKKARGDYANAFARAGAMTTSEAIAVAERAGWRVSRIKRVTGGVFAWLALTKG